MAGKLSPEQWARVERLFEAVMARPSDDRLDFLRSEAEAEGWLLAEVESLVAHARTEAGMPLEEIVERAARDAGITGGAAIGTRLGPYRIESELGRGGMGVVYLGTREGDDFEQRVAIKLLPGALYSEEMTWRFRNERRILASLEHPGVARFLDGGATAEGVPYVVMEYVDGVPIDEYCDRSNADLDTRLDLFEKVCQAVGHAHGRLVVHRDIKPANILVDASGMPRLLDFGIAKLIEPEGAGDDRTVTRIMTPQFASPEQVRGEPATTATDIYALGALLYLLLTGRRPHQDADSSSELARRIVQEDPPAPSTASGDRRLEGDLDTIVLKALRRDPSERYASVDRLMQDLAAYRASLPISARAPTFAYRARKFAARNRAAVLAGGVALVAITIGSAAAMVGMFRAREAEAIALEEARVAEEVSEFLVELFGEADPANALGEDLTARRLLDAGVARIDRELAGQPELQARLKQTMATSYANLGEVREGLRLYLESLDLAETDELRADLYVDLGWVLSEVDLYDSALVTFDRAIAIAEPRVDTSDTESFASTPSLSETLASAYRDKGVVLTSLRDTSAALAALETGVRLYEMLDEPIELGTALTSAAYGYGEFGTLEDAQRNYRRALDIYDVELDPRHPRVLLAWDGLAATYARREVFDSARAIFERLLPVQEDVWGPGHPKTAQTLHNLGAMSSDAGDDEAAEGYIRRAIEIEEALEPNSVSTTIGLNNLALIRMRAEDYAEAEELWMRATEIRRAALGRDNPRTVSTLLGVANMRRLQDEWPGSEEAYAEAIGYLRSGGPVAAPILIDYAQVLRALGRDEAADAIDAERAANEAADPTAR